MQLADFWPSAHPSLVALSLLLVTWLARWIVRRSREDLHRLPGPSKSTAHWLWGHEFEVFEHQACESYTNWMGEYGPLYKIKSALHHPDTIIAGDHAAVQHIFQDTDNYVKSPAFRPPIANLIGKGLVWAEGDDHRKQRQLLTAAFTQESVRGMANDVSECAEKLESRLTNHILSNRGGTIVNIVEWISPCTLDIIGRVGFGHDFGFGTSPEAHAIASSWSAHVNTGLTSAGFYAPIVLKTLPFITKLPLKTIQSQGVVKTVTQGLAYKLIEKGVQKEGRGKDILSILLSADGKVEGGLTNQQIVDNLSTFTLVGSETVAASICYTLMELARHPEKQHKLRTEILQGARELSYDDIQKLSYLDAVVKEGLRLHPASPQTERVALRDDVIPLSTPITTKDGKVLSSIRVRAGQVFHIPFMSMQKYAPVWGPDAGEFLPERWVTPGMMPSPADLPHGWSGLVTFCDGPRNCIGYRLALFEFKVILASLVRSLEFQDTGAVIEEKISQTMQPVVDGKGGVLPLKVSLASNGA